MFFLPLICTYNERNGYLFEYILYPSKYPSTKNLSEYQLIYLKSKHLSIKYATLDHKTSLKGKFFEIEIYTSPES